jgi:hypothetical protein
LCYYNDDGDDFDDDVDDDNDDDDEDCKFGTVMMMLR